MILTQERLKEVLHYNQKTGIFTWRARIARCIHIGGIAGSNAGRGYWQIAIFGVCYPAHRLAWFYMTGKWPEADIDHENHIRNDNRWENLRNGSRSFNMQNQRKAHSDNSIGFLGVSRNGKGFIAKIVLNYKKYRLGTYSTPELAHQAYLKAKREMHPGCTI